MENNQTRINGVCRSCGCTGALAAADARAIGLLDEFLAGKYTCCQVVQWADEQWLAWHNAGLTDGKKPEEVTSALEIDPDEVFVHVRRRKPD